MPKRDEVAEIRRLRYLLDPAAWDMEEYFGIRTAMDRWADRRKAKSIELAKVDAIDTWERLKTDQILGPIIRMAEKHDPAATSMYGFISPYPSWLKGMRTRRRRALEKAIYDIFPERRGIIPGLVTSLDDNMTYDFNKGRVSITAITSEEVHNMKVHTVHCVFRGSQNARQSYWGTTTYDYLTDRDDIAAGDYVTVIGADGEPITIKVKDITYHHISSKAHKWVITKVDLAGFEATEANRKQAAEERRRLEIKKAELTQQAKAIREKARLRILDDYLDQDPEYRQVQDALQRLNHSESLKDGDTIIISIQSVD